MLVHIGKVIGKPRPRVRTIGGHPALYPDPTGVDFEKELKGEYKRQGNKMHSGPVAVQIMYMRALPKSTKKSVTEAPDTIKPDIDNVAKIVLDALNGVAYKDDKQVVQLNVYKMPRTRIEDDIMFVKVERLKPSVKERMMKVWRLFMQSTGR